MDDFPGRSLSVVVDESVEMDPEQRKAVSIFLEQLKEAGYLVSFGRPEGLIESPVLEALFAVVDMADIVPISTCTIGDLEFTELDFIEMDQYCRRVHGKPMPRDPQMLITDLIAYLEVPPTLRA